MKKNMVKGVSIKFKSYFETVPKLLEVTKLNDFLKKHNSIVLKPNLKNKTTISTPIEFTEAILQFCVNHKSPNSQIYIAEGSDGEDTMQLFEEKGYKALAEKYNVSLIDLNTAETEEIFPTNTLEFESIHYPKLLKESLVISIPKLTTDSETEFVTSLSNMIGAYPASQYVGFFSKSKNKIKKGPIKYAVHDIIRCKMPEVAIIDASEQGYILTGNPLEIDRQALKLLNRDSKSISYLNLINDSSLQDLDREQRKKEAQEAKSNIIK